MLTKDLADTVLSEYWDGELPVDPAKIARDMGAVVTSSPQDSTDQVSSGSFCMKGKTPTIWYSSKEPEVRQRFTIAHELAHYVLGHGEGGRVFRDTSRNFNTMNYDAAESSANRFAAALLMPEQAVKRFVRIGGITNIGKLARKFNVSEVAMQYRLKKLGYIS